MLATGADAFLRSGGAPVFTGFQTLKDLFELVHARVGEHERGVVARHERTAGHDAVPASLKEVEKTLTDLVASHGDSPIIDAG